MSINAYRKSEWDWAPWSLLGFIFSQTLLPLSWNWDPFEQVTRVRRQMPNPPRAWDKASSTPWPITKKMILITEYKSSALRFGLQNFQQFYFDATQDILRYPDLVALVDSVLVQCITNDEVRKFAEKHKSNSYIKKRCYGQVVALALVVIIKVCVHVPKTISCLRVYVYDSQRF